MAAITLKAAIEDSIGSKLRRLQSAQARMSNAPTQDELAIRGRPRMANGDRRPAARLPAPGSRSHRAHPAGERRPPPNGRRCSPSPAHTTSTRCWHSASDRAASRIGSPIPFETPRTTRAGAACNRPCWCARRVTRLTTALQNGGVPVIVLKGAHLASVVYPDPSLRSMLDVDLLVDQNGSRARGHASSSQRVPPGRGRPTDDGPLSDFANHLPRFFQALPPAVELHWKLAANDPATENDHWNRAVPVRLAGVDTLGLCPEDLLLLVCAHACYSHRFMFGLRPICDIAEIVRHFGKTMVWADVLERARQHRWHRGVHLMLRLANEMLGAAVPDAVLRALAVRPRRRRTPDRPLHDPRRQPDLPPDAGADRHLVERHELAGQIPRVCCAVCSRRPIASPRITACRPGRRDCSSTIRCG